MPLKNIKNQLSSDVNENVDNYESDINSAANNSSQSTQDRIARIRAASDRAKQRIDQTEQRVINEIESLPASQQDQLVDLWEEASKTLTGLIENILNRVVQMILNFVRNVIQTVRTIFEGAREVFNKMFT